MTQELFRVFGRIGLLSFGGPAAQIALMHKELVETRDWLTEQEFLRALSFCMLLPGPEAMQLATYAGWKRAGITGGLICGGLFVLPGAVVITALALAYGAYGNLPVAQALFVGVKAAVVIIVIEALIKLASRALKGPSHRAIALAAFVALFLFAVPFPVVIAAAGLIGATTVRVADNTPPAPIISLVGSAKVLMIGTAIWFAPILVLVALNQSFLLDLAQFFATLAVVTFGGAYAVLAYMTQSVVVDFGWISTGAMIDALGLAETTPGPLILVTQFVGMLAGMAQGGIGLALVAGAVTLWVTFVPCFVWIFAGAPLIDWLDSRPRLRGALAAVTAAVVGVIANLSLWFAMHVFFADVAPFAYWPIRTILPDLATAQPLPLLLAGLTALMLLWRKWPLPLVLVISAALSLAASAISGVI
ncbi:MAG: chromate efflux transporter [Pseudomonadota bacterium]